MLKLKLIAILLFLPLAALAIYVSWTHQQHSRAAALKAGGAQVFHAKDAEQLQHFKDR